MTENLKSKLEHGVEMMAEGVNDIVLALEEAGEKDRASEIDRAGMKIVSLSYFSNLMGEALPSGRARGMYDRNFKRNLKKETVEEVW